MPTFDSVIKGGTVIDGQFVPRRRADVAIKDGRIAHIGNVRSSDAKTVLDASGLIVAPGFVDLHTHYDSALFYDPWCSLSGWHGVTSVVIGNCGFGFAPAKPEDQEYLMRMLNRVEAISYDVMKETLPWSWESFPEWMDTLDRTPMGVNAVAYVPLSPLLIYVMGLQESKSRDATDGERARMAQLLREAMQAGACGWSAQRTAAGTGFDFQRDSDGSQFPTDLMTDETALVLAEVLAEFDDAFIQTVFVGTDPVQGMKHLEQLAEVGNCAILYNAVVTDARQPTAHIEIFKWLRDCQTRGLKVYGCALTSGGALTFTFADGWNMFDDSPAWRETTLGSPAEILDKLRDPARRQALKAQPPMGFGLEYLAILKTYSDRFMPIKGTLLPDAARLLGYDDMTDLLIDLIVEDELKTLFQTPQLNQNEALIKDLVVEPFSIWGMSDGGAHQKFITAGAYPTESLIKFVREQELVSLEEAHYRLSALPASCAGFKGRGRLVEGAPADIIVYDYENLQLLPEETAYDMPAGDWRRTRRAEGYRYTIVNGVTTFVDGKCTEATPGRLLRHGH